MVFSQRPHPSFPVFFAVLLARIDVSRILLSPGEVSLESTLTYATSVMTNLYTTILVGIRTWCVLICGARVLCPYRARAPGNTGTPYAATNVPRCRSR
jgi:hypothetical protein